MSLHLTKSLFIKLIILFNNNCVCDLLLKATDTQVIQEVQYVYIAIIGLFLVIEFHTNTVTQLCQAG